MENFTLLNGRVLVQQIQEDEVSEGGIFIPEQAREKPMTSVVHDVAPGYYSDSGAWVPTALKPGDKVLTGKYVGSEIKFEGKTYLILHETDVFGFWGERPENGKNV